MQKLGEMRVIDLDTAERSVLMIKMRNLIVHRYEVIDYDILYQGLKEFHSEFIQIQNDIMKWLEPSGKK